MIVREGLENQLHAFMTGGKAEAAIKSVGCVACFIRRQLRRSAPLPTRQIEGIFHQGLPNAAAAAGRTDANRFDLGSPGAFVAEAGDEGQLQARDDGPGILANDQNLAGVCRDGGKGIVIGLRQGIAQIFARRPQLIIGQKSDNGRKIGNDCAAKLNVLGHENRAKLLRNRGPFWGLYKPKAPICPERLFYAYP